MSYFDDNEDFIIYGQGSRLRQIHRLADRIVGPVDPYFQHSDRWKTATGQIVFVENAETRHLVNTLAKLKRENRGPVLQGSIQAELSRRGK